MASSDKKRELQPWQRPAFEKGNTAAATHNSYAIVKLRARAAEIEAYYERHVPGDEFAGARARQAMITAQIEKAEVAVANAQSGELERLREDLRRWYVLAWRGDSELGLTPASAARLRRDLGVGADAAGRAVERHLRETYGDGEKSTETAL